MAEDERLLELLEVKNESGSVTLWSKEQLHQPYTPSDQAFALVVSDRICEIDELISLRDQYDTAKVCYLVSNRPDYTELQRLRSLCSAHNIVMVPPHRSLEQICETVLGRKQDRVNTKLIACISALPQLGLTAAVLHAAVRLGELTGKRTAVIGLNGWNPGDTQISYEGKYLDELWGSLHSSQLTSQELTEKMHRLSPEASYLAGNRDWKRLYYYTPEGVGKLIALASEQFELVFADTGSFLDHALAAQAVSQADLTLLQLDQSLAAREQWQRTKQQIAGPVLGYDASKFLLFFNQIRRSAELEHEKQISKQIGIPYIGSIPYRQTVRNAESERGTLAASMSDLQEEMDKMCLALARYFELPVRQSAAHSASAHSGGLLARLLKPRSKAMRL